jgi:putative membrane protein
VGKNFLIKRTSIWNEEETVVPIHNAQIVSVSQTFWQVQSRTANLLVQTAADNVSFRFFDETEIKNISNYLLFRVEH